MSVSGILGDISVKLQVLLNDHLQTGDGHCLLVQLHQQVSQQFQRFCLCLFGDHLQRGQAGELVKQVEQASRLRLSQICIEKRLLKLTVHRQITGFGDGRRQKMGPAGLSVDAVLRHKVIVSNWNVVHYQKQSFGLGETVVYFLLYLGSK